MPSSEGVDGPAVTGTAEILEGRYVLHELLGRGGMADVHRATDLRLERQVAVKLLRHPPAADLRRFIIEARMLARLSHPNLVRLLDSGSDTARAWLVMELVEGPSLAQRLASGAMSPAEAADLGRGVSAALAYVHEEGIVHRDVKPGNILFGAGGRAMLADFGVARLVDSTVLTAAGSTVGTPAYLAPEQLEGKQVGPPADVYALGLVLAEALTARRVFQGVASEAVAARLAHDPQLPPELAPLWRLLLSSMTRRTPESRPTAADVCAVLATATGGVGPDDPTHRLPVPVRNRRAVRARLLVAGAACALALGLIFGLGVLGSHPPRPAAAGSHRKTSLSPSSTTIPASSTTTRPSSTTTTAPRAATTISPNSLPVALGELVSTVEQGVERGTIEPGAAQDVIAGIQPIVAQADQLSPDQIASQLSNLAQKVGADVANHEIMTRSTIDSLEAAINRVAALSGVKVPLDFAAPAPPGPPPGHGHHGHGHGDAQA